MKSAKLFFLEVLMTTSYGFKLDSCISVDAFLVYPKALKYISDSQKRAPVLPVMAMPHKDHLREK
jgi:hypothetical protein